VDTISLQQLAGLLAIRNQVATQITATTGRPALLGHLGAYIAAQVFDIALEASAANEAFDGRFKSRPFAGKAVDVSWYPRRENLIDLRADDPPDHYLVRSEPRGPAASARGDDRPWLIEAVHLFVARTLLDCLKRRGAKIGIAASVASDSWGPSQWHPTTSPGLPELTQEQGDALCLFSLAATRLRGLDNSQSKRRPPITIYLHVNPPPNRGVHVVELPRLS
jgi:hypothetical protein